MFAEEKPIWECFDELDETKPVNNISIIQKVQEEVKEQDIMIKPAIIVSAKSINPIITSELDGFLYKGLTNLHLVSGKIKRIEPDKINTKILIQAIKDTEDEEEIIVPNEFCMKTTLDIGDTVNALVQENKCIEFKLGPYHGYSKWDFYSKTNKKAFIEFLVKP